MKSQLKKQMKITNNENSESSDESSYTPETKINECLCPEVFISEDDSIVTGDSDIDLF